MPNFEPIWIKYAEFENIFQFYWNPIWFEFVPVKDPGKEQKYFTFVIHSISQYARVFVRRHDIQHNDTQHNDTQHKDVICDTQHSYTQQNKTAIIMNVVMLSVAVYLL